MHPASSCWACVSGGEQSWYKLHSLHGKPTAEQEPTWEEAGMSRKPEEGQRDCWGEGRGLTAMVMLPSILLLYLKFLPWSFLIPATSSYWPIPSHSLSPRQEFSPCFYSWRFIICFLYVLCLLYSSVSLSLLVFFNVRYIYSITILFSFLLLYIFGVIFIVIALGMIINVLSCNNPDQIISV